MNKAASLGVLALALTGVVAWSTSPSLARDETPDMKTKIPAKALEALKARFPKATIAGADAERETVTLYEVELRQGGKSFDAVVTADGALVSVERKLTTGELPGKVRQALVKACGSERNLLKVEREEVHGVLKLVRLKRPQVNYEVKARKGKRIVALLCSSDGKVTADDDDEDEAKAKADDDDEAKDDDDDDDDDKGDKDDDDDDDDDDD